MSIYYVANNKTMVVGIHMGKDAQGQAYGLRITKEHYQYLSQNKQEKSAKEKKSE